MLPWCQDCKPLIDGFEHVASNGTVVYCDVVLDTNHTTAECVTAQRDLIACEDNAATYRNAALLFVIYAATFGPPVRVLCLTNVISLVVTAVYVRAWGVNVVSMHRPTSAGTGFTASTSWFVSGLLCACVCWKEPACCECCLPTV